LTGVSDLNIIILIFVWMKSRYYIFLFFLLLAVGCRQRTVMPLLEKAESLMNNSPDSSQLLLESIESPEELPIEEYATWCLLVTQARDKNYVEHTSDSIIDIAVRYFAGQEDPHRKAHAYYCKGRVLSDLDFSEEALDAYLKAKEFVQETTDYPLQARICNHLGTLYWENFDKLNSLKNYKEAYQAYLQCQDTIGLVSVLRNIGDGMLALTRLDSASFYLNQAWKLAEQGNVYSQKPYVLSSLGVLYEEQGEYEKALDMNKKALSYMEGETFLSSRYYAIGDLYEKLHRLDSAQYYAQKALKGEDLSIQCSVNRLLYKIHTQKGSLQEAYLSNERYLLLRDSIERVYNPQQLAKVEALYKQERQENRHNRQLHVARIRSYSWAIGGLGAIVTALLIYIVLHKRLERQKQQNREIQYQLDKLQESLSENRNVIKEKEKSLVLIRQKLTDVQKRIALLEEEQLQSIEQFAEIDQERNRLYEEKERLLLEKKGMLEQNEKLLHQRKNQLEALITSNQRLKQMEQLETYLKQLTKEKEFWIVSFEELKNERETLHQELLKRLEQYRGKCRKYEHWREMLLQNNLYLRKALTIVTSEPWSEQEWMEFMNSFKLLYPGFVEQLSLLAPLSEREIRVCCLTRLGVKTTKVSYLLGLGSDMVTKIKADIRKRCFPMEKGNYLDPILEKWY